jgi:hypothetical protein
MMPAMQYIYEKAPDPLSLDVYPLSEGASGYVLNNCERPGAPIRETKFACTAAADGVTV